MGTREKRKRRRRARVPSAAAGRDHEGDHGGREPSSLRAEGFSRRRVVGRGVEGPRGAQGCQDEPGPELADPVAALPSAAQVPGALSAAAVDVANADAVVAVDVAVDVDAESRGRPEDRDERRAASCSQERRGTDA